MSEDIQQGFEHRTFERLKAASGKLNLLLGYVRDIQHACETSKTEAEFRSKTDDAVARIADLFSVAGLNDLDWVKQVYNWNRP